MAWFGLGLGLGLAASPGFGLASIFCIGLEYLARGSSHKGVELWLELLGVEWGSRFGG